VWSWWQPGSVHAARWPTVDEVDRLVAPDQEDVAALENAIQVLGEIRRIKSQASKSPRTRFQTVRVSWDSSTIDRLRMVEVDLRSAAAADRFEFEASGAPLAIEVDFAPEVAPGEARG
jgi:valyl-tRNA synthetase